MMMQMVNIDLISNTFSDIGVRAYQERDTKSKTRILMNLFSFINDPHTAVCILLWHIVLATPFTIQ